MDIRALSPAGLLSLYDAIAVALLHDDAQPPTQAKTYGVRQHGDWRVWADALEAELNRRDLTFSPIPW